MTGSIHSAVRTGRDRWIAKQPYRHHMGAGQVETSPARRGVVVLRGKRMLPLARLPSAHAPNVYAVTSSFASFQASMPPTMLASFWNPASFIRVEATIDR